MHRIVLDTNILISAGIWDYSIAHKLIEAAIDRGTEIFTSPFIIEEFQEVMKRDFEASEESVAKRTLFVMKFARMVYPVLSYSVVKEDPDDNKIVECAVAAEADYIITYDKHLLALISFMGIKIINPIEALKRL